jgi:Antibiotic biosynthesis monooxygenase
MATITTIVRFEMPAESADRFFTFWRDVIRPKVNKQPGLIDGIFHRNIDPDSSVQFINVARWESAEELEAALKAAVEEMHQESIEMAGVFHQLGVEVSQNNYAPVVMYGQDSNSATSQP